MRLGLALGYWGRGPDPRHLELARAAERLGYDSVWTAEAWGSDAFTALTWIAAHTSRIKLGTGIAQMAARTPTATAMHALTLDHLSGGRIAAGPGAVRTTGRRGVVRTAVPQEPADRHPRVCGRDPPSAAPGRAGGVGRALPPAPLPRHGRHRPRQAAQAHHPPAARRASLLLGAEGPKNIAQTTRIADGWLPLYWSPRRTEVYRASLSEAPEGFLIAPMARAMVCDDVAEGLLPVKAMLGFYIGGMGHAAKNFHADLMARMGYEEEARQVQRLFLEGHAAGGGAGRTGRLRR